MKRRILICSMVIVLLVSMTALFILCKPAQQERSMGRFVEISRSDYYIGANMREYIVYDKDTYLVYIYTVSHDSFSITPYVMRDSYGMLTVGAYDLKSGKIIPAEPDYEDEVELVVLGCK